MTTFRTRRFMARLAESTADLHADDFLPPSNAQTASWDALPEDNPWKAGLQAIRDAFRCDDCAPGVLCGVHEKAWAEYTEQQDEDWWSA